MDLRMYVWFLFWKVSRMFGFYSGKCLVWLKKALVLHLTCIHDWNLVILLSVDSKDVLAKTVYLYCGKVCACSCTQKAQLAKDLHCIFELVIISFFSWTPVIEGFPTSAFCLPMLSSTYLR